MMHSRLNILFIESQPEDAAWVQQTLDEQFPRGYVLDRVKSLAEAKSALAEQKFDVILTELAIVDAQGLETFLKLQELSEKLPIVILTHHDDEELAMTCVRQGAQDYLIKSKTDAHALGRALRYSVERQNVNEKLKILTLEDELTGLYNQRGFYALAHEYAALARRSNQSLLMLFIDLDGLKAINDAHGHTEGSRCIVAASAVLERTFRDTDLIARFGGDEFAVLLLETADQTMELVMERLQANLTRHNTQMRRGYDLAMSVGFSRFDPKDPRPVEELLREADQNMYTEKRKRKAARVD